MILFSTFDPFFSSDRWNWIMDDPGGIWTEWVNAAEGTKKGWVEIPLLERKDDYDHF